MLVDFTASEQWWLSTVLDPFDAWDKNALMTINEATSGKSVITTIKPLACNRSIAVMAMNKHV